LVPTTIYLAAGDNEEAFWAQLLVVVILAAGGGIWTIVKARSRRFRQRVDDKIIETFLEPKNTTGHKLRIENKEPGIQNYQFKIPGSHGTQGKLPTQKSRDLKSGMDLLAGGFLVKIIESRHAGISSDSLDIKMQKMCFAEMKRRNELEAVSSEALKAYTIDELGHYSKAIQRQAMEELFHRTSQEGS
jgi:hypothetical protein